MTSNKKTKEQVGYEPAQCCFNCGGFARPHTPGVVLGSCVRVEGAIHPADTCQLFQWALADDDDGDGRPEIRRHLSLSALPRQAEVSATDEAAGGLAMAVRPPIS